MRLLLEPQDYGNGVQHLIRPNDAPHHHTDHNHNQIAP